MLPVMDSESSKASRGRLITVLVLVLLVYPLSPGPVLAWTDRSRPHRWMALYIPLNYAYQNVPAVRAFYDWYLPIWQKPKSADFE